MTVTTKRWITPARLHRRPVSTAWRSWLYVLCSLHSRLIYRLYSGWVLPSIHIRRLIHSRTTQIIITIAYYAAKSPLCSKKSIEASNNLRKLKLILGLSSLPIFIPNLQKLEHNQQPTSKSSRGLTLAFCSSTSTVVSIGRVAKTNRSHVIAFWCRRTAALSPMADFFPRMNLLHFLYSSQLPFPR